MRTQSVRLLNIYLPRISEYPNREIPQDKTRKEIIFIFLEEKYKSFAYPYYYLHLFV